MKFVAAAAFVFAGVSAWLVWGRVNPVEPSVLVPSEPVACTAEALLCPDGTVVGREGPDCAFAACPTPIATSTPEMSGASTTPSLVKEVTLAVGETGTVNGLALTFMNVIQDSRCPVDVVCVQAGSVTAKVSLTYGLTTEAKNIVSGAEPVMVGSYRISLGNVLPRAESTKHIAPSAYRITVRVESR